MSHHIKKLVLIVISAVITESTLWSQQANIVLSQQLSGVQFYEASNSITLNPGFNFQATSTDVMIADIIPTVTNSDYQFEELLESSSLNVNTSYPVGSINNSISVGPTGALNCSIPIDLPPGRGGIKPQLSLVYNNQGGDGILGVGWTLAGFSSVTRVPTNYYFDGYVVSVLPSRS